MRNLDKVKGLNFYTMFLALLFIGNLNLWATDFITTWKTNNPGTSTSSQITIPTTGTGYNYNVDWGDGYTSSAQTGNSTHTYASAGTYTVKISGVFPRIYFNSGGDMQKILSVEQWGTQVWSSMARSFYGASNLVINAMDAPDLSLVTELYMTFRDATSLNQNINHWDVSNISSMRRAFAGATSYNQPLNSWDVSNVTNFESMFDGASSFNQDINSWVVSSATLLKMMFKNATAFNKPLSLWNTGNATTFEQMFYGASAFNQPINTWNTQNVTHMPYMFRDAISFNQNIGSWNTSSVIYFYGMFSNAAVFDQDIGFWNISSTINVGFMFENAASFNQDIGSWNISGVTSLNRMFNGAVSFDQDISSWDVSNVTVMTDMFLGGKLSISNYDALLTEWGLTGPVQSNVNFHGGFSQYCDTMASLGRISLISNDGWTITDGGKSCGEFITTWKTDNLGTSLDDEITIPTMGIGYNYFVDWGDGNTNSGVTGNITHAYTSPGTYTVKISGDFQRIFFNNGGDRQKILSVEQWGTQVWSSMEKAFYGASNLVVNATDAPDLSATLVMTRMFSSATSLNSDINHWDVSNIIRMEYVFDEASSFNQPLNNWDVSSVTTMQGMFEESPFNQNIGNWNVGLVKDMFYMFKNTTAFNQDISAWNTSNVTNMYGMFLNASSFNLNIDTWDVSAVVNMGYMFKNALAYNQPLNSWNVGNVTSFLQTFHGASSFNQPLNNWNTASVTNMMSMFQNGGLFNQDIGTWDVSNVINFSWMFYNAISFDQDIGGWSTSSATNFSSTFRNASGFDQNIGPWNVSNVTNMTDMFNGAGLSISNYDSLLIGWETQIVQNSVNFDAGNSEYCATAAQTARANLIANDSWTILDHGLNCSALDFITTWKTDNIGTSGNDQITIPTSGAGYNYSVDWGDGNTSTGLTGDFTYTYASVGTYTVKISGDFPRIYFNNNGDKEKIISIEQWGSQTWISMSHAFQGAINLVINALDAPDLSSVSDMSFMFMYASSLNQDISSWDVSNVTNMSRMFNSAISFNQDIGAWNVGSVVNMLSMFKGASTFNQDIGAWDVSSVTTLQAIFMNASAFNQNIGLWNTGNVTTFRDVFNGANNFNQDISTWNTANGTNMFSMFNNANNFNQDISTWNTNLVIDMNQMFYKAYAFDQNIGGWDVTNVTDMTNMFLSAGLSIPNYEALLTGWDAQALQNGVNFHAGSSQYCSSAAETARANMITIDGWIITDAGSNCAGYFITTWKTDNPGTSSNTQITIPTNGLIGGYNYTVDWGDGNINSGVTGNITHTYASSGTYTVKITGSFPSIYFTNGGDKEKILSVEQWGNIAWLDFGNSFYGAINLLINTADSPDLSGVTDLGQMFKGALSVNQDLSNWNTGTITEMNQMFSGAVLFNSNIGLWDVSNVTNMEGMFSGAVFFNQDIGSWDMGNVTVIMRMFFNASSFNQDIGAWDVSSVTSLNQMFQNAISFNQDLNLWNTGNVTTMHSTLKGASSFNQNITSWDVSNVTNFQATFMNASAFNQNIGLWNTGSVTTFRDMFNGASIFNQDIGLWDVSNVTSMRAMFRNAIDFDQGIGSWNTINVTDSRHMFNGAASFNQIIGAWNTSQITNMLAMFRDAVEFDQDISNWDITSVTSFANIFNGAELSIANYDSLLIGWNAQNPISTLSFHGGSSRYCDPLAESARANLIASNFWTVVDSGLACITWNGSVWNGGSGTGEAPSDAITDLEKFIVVISGDTAVISENAKVDSLVMRENAIMEISSCLNVQASAVSMDSTASIIISAASESDYGQYNGPALANTTVEMKLEHYGWHQLASPILNARMDDLVATTSTGGSGNLIFAASTIVPEGDTSQFRWYDTQEYGGEDIGYGEDVGYSSAFGTWFGAKGSDNFDKRPSMFFVNATATNDTPLPLTISLTGTTNGLAKSWTTDIDNFGWNLISNPYPAALDWESIEGRLSGDTALWKYGNTISIWEPENQNYAIYMAESGTGTNGTNVNGGAGVSLSQGNRYIAPFQSFWVQRSDYVGENSTSSKPKLLGLELTDRADCMTPKHFRMEVSSLERVRLKLSNKSNSYFDEMVINFNDEYDASVSLEKDAFKLPSPNPKVPMIMTKVENKNLAIHGRSFDKEHIRIPLYIEAELGKSLNIGLQEFPEGKYAWIEDVSSGKLYSINENDDFEFTNFHKGLTHSYNLLLSNSPENINEDEVDFHYSVVGDLLEIEMDSSIEYNVVVTDLLGRVLNRWKAGEGSLSIDMIDWAHQSYIVSIYGMKRSSVFKIVR